MTLPNRMLACALLLVLAATTACTDGAQPPEPEPIPDRITTLDLRSIHDSLFLGRTVKLMPVATGDTAIIKNGRYTYSSSDTTLAVVDSTGVVLGLGVGRVSITVELDGKRATKSLRVMLTDVDGGVVLDDPVTSEGTTTLCATAAGRAYCRSQFFTPDSAPLFVAKPGGAGERIARLQASLHAVCGLTEDGRAMCWGANVHYVFGHGGTVVADTGPVAVRTNVRFSKLAHAGHAQSCGINKVDQVVHCWGHNDGYQLARGTLSPHDSNVAPVSGNLKAKQVFTANFITCIIDLNDAAHCAGQIGTTSTRRLLGIEDADGDAPMLMPVAGGHRFSTLSLGAQGACGLELNGDVYCWGANGGGQLGNGTTTTSFGPQRVEADVKFRSIFSGGSSVYGGGAYAVAMNGDVYAWGAIRPTSIGTRLGARALRPTLLLKGVQARHIFGSFGSICINTSTSQTLCWS